MRWRFIAGAAALALSGCGQGGAPVDGNGTDMRTNQTETVDNGALPVRGAASATTNPAPDRADAPAFDCAQSGNAVERMICDDADLARRDRVLADEYRTANARLSGAAADRLRDEQRAFLRLRDACESADCIAQSYDARIVALQRLNAGTADDPAGGGDKADASGKSCLMTAGRKQADLLVKRCVAASPATHPPCNVANSCAMIESEIERSCAMFDGHESYYPEFCDEYRTE